MLSADCKAFCGFYVAQAGSELFNKKSEVILVRDGNSTTITMNNDFSGDANDFAMVVPVPVVLKEKDIKVVNPSIFKTLDAYSAPRLVEYFDQSPCRRDYLEDAESLDVVAVAESNIGMVRRALTKEKKYKVTIEAEYKVAEYDIVILSAEESNGLKKYLISEGYKIPEKAEKVLAPYIKNKLKFFLVKVNKKEMRKQSKEFLSPIQIKFNSDRFMLPIRLGMANSTGEQDMIVYAFTKTGRVECTNYRTNKMPSARKIPTFVKQKFGDFYHDLFANAYNREGKNSVFLEYAWNVTPSWGGMKCDPCTGNPPYFTDLSQAGVNWANSPGQPVFFTRLHVRYTEDKFPQDLQFQVTPNREHYQARYILTHPAQGDLSCDEAEAYIKSVKERRTVELQELAYLTGWNTRIYTKYVSDGLAVEDHNMELEGNPWDRNEPKKGGSNFPLIIFILSLSALISYIILQFKAARA